MSRYVVRRLLLFIPSLLGVSLIVFAAMRIVPGDPAEAIFAARGGGGDVIPSEQELTAIRHGLGLDKPLHEQYFEWIFGSLRGDLGTSYVTSEFVADEIKRRFPMTLELAVMALAISWILALPIGTMMALKQDTWIDYVLRLVSIGGITLPTFWVGILIIFFLVMFFDWIPPLGYSSLWNDPSKNLQQLIWPALAQGYWLTAVVSRMTRSCMLEVLREDYVRTARAKGLMERVVIYRHALKNAMLPVITVSASQFGHLLGGVVVIEIVFSLPGIGRSLVTSINYRDYPMIQTIIMLMALFFLVINLLVDLIYGWLDPRIRYQ